MNKKLLFLTLAGLALPVLASAQCTLCAQIIHSIEQTALLIASGVVVVLWIVTGILFLTSQGDPGKLKSAKTSLFSAVAGTALVIIAGSAIALVSQGIGL